MVSISSFNKYLHWQDWILSNILSGIVVDLCFQVCVRESKRMLEEDTNQKYFEMKTRDEGLKLGSKDLSLVKTVHLVEGACWLI